MVALNISSDSASLFKAAADDFMRRANEYVKQKGVFNVVLSGGNTPKKFYTLLTTEAYKNNIPWDKINFFFGDERYVPEDQPTNNFYMAHQYLFSQVNVPMVNVFQIPTEYEDPNKAAQDYAATIRDTLHLKANELPQFDLIYLGLGSNAHTASLMPGTDLVKAYANNAGGIDRYQITAACWVSELNMYRITLTPPAINNSACIAFLVEGEDKVEAVWQILEGPRDAVMYPAQLIEANKGQLIWFLDQAAAGRLSRHSRE